MQITLRDITLANWQECIHLQLDPEQSRLLASNLYSLAEAKVQPELEPQAIYADEQMVGFVMVQYAEPENCYWIPRYMIDARYQGQGLGKRAMQAVIDRLKSQRPDAAIMISLTPTNQPARNLYLNLGFEDTGEHRQGEDVLRYP